jgi:hypothetical protein
MRFAYDYLDIGGGISADVSRMQRAEQIYC